MTDTSASDAIASSAAQFRAAGTKAAETTRLLNERILDQAETNVREAFAALRAAAGCGSLPNVMKIQGDYVRAQAARSMAQAKEIGELIGGFGHDAVRNASLD